MSAADCSVVDQCEGPTTVAVTVDNPAPALTAPVPGQEVRGDTLSATADAPAGAAVRFVVDGSTSGPGVATDTTAPYAVTLDTEGLGDGLHTVRAYLCRDAVTCDGSRAAEAPVTVVRLHPGIVSVSPSAISPNGDGRQDSAKVTYRLDRSQTPTLAGPQPVRRGHLSQGARPPGRRPAHSHLDRPTIGRARGCRRDLRRPGVHGGR